CCAFCCVVLVLSFFLLFFFSSRRRHTRFSRDWSSDVCSSDLGVAQCLSTAVASALGAEHGGVADGASMDDEFCGGVLLDAAHAVSWLVAWAWSGLLVRCHPAHHGEAEARCGMTGVCGSSVMASRRARAACSFGKRRLEVQYLRRFGRRYR